MTTFTCDCGTKIQRYPAHKPQFTGVTCTNCRSKWKTYAHHDSEDGQMGLWFAYYSCTCGSHPLNIPPKLTKCICEVGELR